MDIEGEYDYAAYWTCCWILYWFVVLGLGGAIASKIVTHRPYAVFLTLCGLVAGVFHVGPDIS
ncbi:MAG: hypothetical protein K9M57_06215 [Phycisphaerae bacterium]|nr:hypothetical protein [Phycisphaerae bacterium]